MEKIVGLSTKGRARLVELEQVKAGGRRWWLLPSGWRLYRTRFPGQLTALITPPPGGAPDAQRPVSGSRGAR